MGQSVSGSSSGGSGYTRKVYFDPEADKSKGPVYWIHDSELIQKMDEVVNVDEEIRHIRSYKHPLYSWQLMDNVLYHAFIVFETDGWWWSIEKNEENVTIQRSKHFDYVRDKYRRTDRLTPISEIKRSRGRGTIRDLIRYLYKENYVLRDYDVLLHNCKDFANAVYDYISID